MRLLLDANLSPRIAVRLLSAGVAVTHVCEHGLTVATDEVILRHAIELDATIVSADSDFATLLALGGLRVPSLILLRSSDHLTPDEQADLLLADSRSGRKGGVLPWALLVIDSVASLAANVAVALPTLIGRVIAAWPSFALTASYELLTRGRRASRPLCGLWTPV